ncbi:MAG TPA: DNA polymerase III subunit epsilon [Accumulibacter sp.]|uniref:DNA polymerase III subunit epsilon n=1 Tax=Accumulibacter sp. TaxID=2053492 RepID=UPI002B633DC7|nr:DNA polymerase III subunit epsilon [Accumulibacter sp.]HMW18058.1 DNA polymerase III subunit epsilon [Accumulibacter sp.]HMX22492.1 DNA polymerase III subunit epsilon [Accumulibacter sp.]HMY07973.1 DNA polymerase III subunit epsilon [Accumulibacter sp.]HNC20147.1 DNA polymerase III subunit epsilon [Accumulibacter sp.]HND80663.1 DNA polymerase III subunit epsilon [Accumulibacter sp.]
MRQIFLDTETTGLEHKLGHRIIEIAGVEMCNRRLTKRHFHRYINPQREIDSGAQAVHGISEEFLADKPLFAEIVAEFLDFIRGAELVIHNAPFDIGFLNTELARLDLPPVHSVCQGVCDTLRLAKETHPGKKNNLNALCERYGIDNSQRTLHGALLDAELLAEVYLAMTRGQESLIIDLPDDNHSLGTSLQATGDGAANQPLRVIVATEEEIGAHLAILAGIQEASKGHCLWLNVEK